MFKKTLRVLCITFVVALLVPAAFAATAGWEFSGVGTEFTNGSWTFGEVFTTTSSFNVDYLGYYDPSTGMTDSHWVGLYDASGDLLASTTITSASGFSTAHFLYNAITPLTLNADATYVVEGISGADDVYAYDDTGFTTYAPITIDGHNFVSGGGQTFNGTGLESDGSTDGEWGPNFGFDAASAAPEPSSLMLFGSGMLLLAGALRRKATR